MHLGQNQFASGQYCLIRWKNAKKMYDTMVVYILVCSTALHCRQIEDATALTCIPQETITNNKQQSTINKQQTTNNKQQTTNNKQQSDNLMS
jgi:hypothetical protein